ncbi:expressed unknown protein [Seminavis robusta]|uniref:EF-hand domain-containing protein n=1 Tax=Seminavis robusta TaxID=568900 RepID=A0A9N8EQ39_9STRA|nr:expressed unknown protein [Seminavis robusta]|eukprot:Sro1372_g267170.1 n/a (550) ;mRNA; f:15270-16919
MLVHVTAEEPPASTRNGTTSTTTLSSTPFFGDPTLSGQHFRITVLEHPGYVDIITMPEEEEDGRLQFSGYIIDVLEELAKPNRANFTYDLVTPSGYGSLCEPRLTPNKEGNPDDAFGKRYFQAYQCGESDVNDRPKTHYTTDFYWGIFYITPERLKANRFTIPIAPPARATLGMMGTATHIQNIHELAASNNTQNYQICAFDGTAYKDSLVLSFPQLHFKGISYAEDVHTLLHEGVCDIIIESYPVLKQTVLQLYNDNTCIANGKPIGVIGEPLEYGLNYFAFGIRDDLPESVVRTLDFWLQALMACFPEDPDGYCPNGVGSTSQMYNVHGGTGQECGYEQYPPNTDDSGLHVAAIVTIAITPVLLVVTLGMIYHLHRLKHQEKRMKKRFIQQLARNIDIGPSVRQISVEKLSETFQHIGGKDGKISKEDLAKWMNDLHLDFLSDKDFDRLWDTMDMEGTGYVDPIDFFAFLNECDKQFKEVHEEFSSLPKSEKLKLAARRLSNIKAVGEEGVDRMERRNNRRSRFQIPGLASSNPLGSSAAFSAPSQL